MHALLVARNVCNFGFYTPFDLFVQLYRFWYNSGVKPSLHVSTTKGQSKKSVWHPGGGPGLAGMPGERAFSIAARERDWGIAVANPQPGDPTRCAPKRSELPAS